MKFYGRVLGGKRDKLLDFRSDPGHDPAFTEVYALLVLGI